MFEPHQNRPDQPVESLWFVLKRGMVLVHAHAEGPRIPRGSAPPDIEIQEDHVLGSLQDTPVYGIGVADHVDEPDEHMWVPLRQLFGQVPEHEWTLAGRAEQIIQWDRTHKFCGRCGTPTDLVGHERSRTCPKCNLMAFPRLSPATIMLVTRNNDTEALLAHGARFPGRFYSALAGFVEPGESLEECVVREIKEEVGIDVDNVTYFGSQPWPFPNSLMIGFTANYVGGDIELQPEEIVDAGWYTPDNLPPSPRGGMSIAGWLIEDWLRRNGAA